MPRPRSRECRKSGRCLYGTAQMRLNAFWVALVMPSPASSASTMPITSAAVLPVSECTFFELGVHDRQLPECAAEDLVLLDGVALEDEAEDRHEYQQQREQRDERVVGDQRGELTGLVVAELLDHADEEAESWAALLAAIERLEMVGEAHLSAPSGSRWCGAATASIENWEGGQRAAGCDIPVCLPDRSSKHEAWAAAGSPARAQAKGLTRPSGSPRWRAPGARCCFAPIVIDCAGRISRTASARRRSSS